MMIRDRIVAALDAAPYPLRVSELADVVYADDPDGGPLFAREIVRVVTVDRNFYSLAGREYGPRPADPRIAVIRRMRRAGRSCRETAEQFGIHPSYASVLSRKAA